MDVSISDCLSDVDQEDLNPLPGPSQPTFTEDLVRPRSKTLQCMLLPISAKFLQEWISWPGIVWHLINPFLDIDIPRTSHPRAHVLGRVHRSRRYNAFGPFYAVVAVLFEREILRYRTIVTERTNIEIKTLEPASTGFKVTFRLDHEIVKGRQRSEQEAGMN